MMRTAAIIMVMSTSLVSGDGKYWWMGSGGAFSDGSSNSNNNYQQQQPNNNYQGSGSQNVGSNVLPITQGIQSQVSGGGGSCPAVTSVPPVSQCSGRVSDCWSVGQLDVDCLNNALCCFDGCANVCQGAGSRSPAPPPNPRPAQPKPTRQQNQQPAKKVQQKPKVHKQRPKVNKVKTNPWPNKTQQQPRPQQQPARRPQVNNNNNNRPYTGPQAESKPFVRCPSAMKCVPKVNCNLEGVMVNEILDYSPAVEILRVPFLVSTW